MNAQEIIDLEQKYVAHTYNRAPMVFERGDGVVLYDSEGREYLDFVAGIAVNALGYGDKDVLAVLHDQAQKLVHVSNLYHTEPHALLARDLCERSFADRVFFCNSGTEANEGAMKFARKWARTRTGDDEKCEIVTFSHAFHGRSMGALAITYNAKYRKPFEPLIQGVRWAKYNDLSTAEEVVGERTAAVIVEPVQGEGGIQPASQEFLRGLRDLCDMNGAALIFDEVQCGLGRTGTLWAYEQYEVQPDIMTLAKPLGSGMPIGAILMIEDIASVLAPGDHGSTFAASPLVTAVARTVLNKISRSEMLEHVQNVGNYMGEQLSELSEHELIVEVRGRGLMWGLELVEEVAVGDVVSAGYERGIITAPSGRNTLRLVPPLIVENTHVDQMVDTIGEILTHLSA